MIAHLSPTPERVKQALLARPFVGAVLLSDDGPRPGDARDGRMFCASLVLPSAAIAHALGQIEGLLPLRTPSWLASHGGLLSLALDDQESLEDMLSPACQARGQEGFAQSSAFASVHERKLWIIEASAGEPEPLIGLAFSYYGSGLNGKLGSRTYYSRDAFSCLWAELCDRLAQRFGLAASPDISEALVHAPDGHSFNTALPQGIQDAWATLAEKQLLADQVGPSMLAGGRRTSL